MMLAKFKIACQVAVAGFLLGSSAEGTAQSIQYDQLQPKVIEDRLRQYSGSNPERETSLKRLFSEAGCTGTRLREQPVQNSAAPNVICTLPGSGDGVIVVGAHFDRVQKGDGVADNWSGASLLPSLFQSLSSKPRTHTFVFISFTDEEEGFVGSKAYVAELGEAEIARIRCMVDIDTLGLGPTEVWDSNSNPELVKDLYSAASRMGLPVKEMNVDGVGDSDGHSFKVRNIPIITLHSVTLETIGVLNTDRDNISAIKLGDYYDSYRLIAGYLTLLDSHLGGRPK